MYDCHFTGRVLSHRMLQIVPACLCAYIYPGNLGDCFECSSGLSESSTSAAESAHWESEGAAIFP